MNSLLVAARGTAALAMLTFMLGMGLAFTGIDVRLGYPLFMGGTIAFIFAQSYVLLREVRQSF